MVFLFLEIIYFVQNFRLLFSVPKMGKKDRKEGLYRGKEKIFFCGPMVQSQENKVRPKKYWSGHEGKSKGGICFNPPDQPLMMW